MINATSFHWTAVIDSINSGYSLCAEEYSLSIFKKLTIFDSILSLLIVQKIAVILWQLFRTPTFFSDAIKQWSTQGRLIYSQINFSFKPDTAEFLGNKIKTLDEILKTNGRFNEIFFSIPKFHKKVSNT